MTAPVTVSNHPFEKAGLGVAPFRCVAVEYRVGPIRSVVDFGNGPVECEVGGPGQPMGTCAYCSQGIAECCVIRDAHGKTFIVGNQCVEKAARDYGEKVVDTALERDRKLALRNARAERERTASAELAWRIEQDAELRELLAARPHPYGFTGKTMLEWAVWMMHSAGASGRTKVRRAIAKLTADNHNTPTEATA